MSIKQYPVSHKNLSKELSALCLAVSSMGMTGYAWAQDAMDIASLEDGHKYHHLDAISVTASGQTLNEVVQPVKVLSESELKQANGSSLGELLDNLPGVSNASFGPGVGRPVIRGLSGNRVKIAVNGNDAADVSAMSNDHAPMADVANADQVEIIYGPGTLLFGSGAIGGVVNVADERFHDVPLVDNDGNSVIEAEVRTSTSSVDQGTQLSAQVNAGLGQNWVVHVDAFQRESENYESPKGEVQNTATEAQGANLGITYLGENSRTGLAVSTLDYEYGVPNENDEAASVKPTQVRFDGLHEILFSSKFLESLKIQFGVNDYEHDELDGSTVVGFFDKTNTEFKSILSFGELQGFSTKLGFHANIQELALCHDHSGCENGVPDYSNLGWDGSKGGDFFPINDSDGNPVEFAHDTPMPETETTDTAVFGLLSSDWSLGKHSGKQEYAVRFDQRVITADPVSINPNSRQDASYYDDETFLATTASAGWTLLSGPQKWGLSLAHTERAPQADEMYWNGDHHATFSYQLDNPDLDKETAHTLDITWQYMGDQHQWNVAGYYYDFDGYIFNQIQNVKDPFHGNDVYQHVQKDAYLTGYEASWQYAVTESLALNAVTDKAIGRLKKGAGSSDNKNLPRIPPLSLLLGVSWQSGHWLIKGDVKYFDEQDQVSENETSTDAYQTLNAMAAYEFEWNKLHMDVRLKGSNLTDELGRNHVSYLKAYSPLPGRNITLDLQVSY